MSSKLVCFLSSLLLVSTVFAQEEEHFDMAQMDDKERREILAKTPDIRIRDVVITGVEDTKPVVIDQWIRIKKGDKLADFNEIETKENLLKLRIFKKLSVAYKVDGDQVDVIVFAEEKWSLYPVPILYVYQDTRFAGIFLVESNALGYNKGYTAGGIISNRGWQYIAGYVDPNIFFTDFFGQIRSAGGSIFAENANAEGEVFQSYQQKRFDLIYDVGYTFWDVFSPEITGGIFTVDLPADLNEDKINPPDAGNVYYQGLKLIYNDQKHRFYYDRGLRSTIEYQHGFPVGATGLTFDNLMGQNRYTMEAFSDHTLTMGVYWAWANMPTVLEHRLGGLEGSRTLPAFLVPADRYFTSSLIYQIPVWKFDWGTLTVINFLEYGTWAQNEDTSQRFFGPGTGFRFYLKNITIPALGMDVAYNLETQSYWFSVAIGFRPAR